jgi:hypothetical protein
VSSLDDLPEDLAALLDVELGDGVDVYSFIPGSANLPAVVVGRPDLIRPFVTGDLWTVELPLYVLQSSGDPIAERTSINNAVVELVSLIGENRTGPSWRAARVVEIREFFDVNVGTSAASACSVICEFMIPNPTP